MRSSGPVADRRGLYGGYHDGDDPVHGKQPLSAYHGYYRQHQYFPLLAYEGHTGFPLACWLRPGTLHAACGAVDVLGRLVGRLREAWP